MLLLKICILILIILFSNSCIDSSFQKEVKFVQYMIDQPDSIKSLIENSEFYDSTMYTGGFSYQDLSDFLRKDSLNDVWITDYGYCNISIEMPKGKQWIQPTKGVFVNCGKYTKIRFYFKEINDSTKLLVISVIPYL